MRRAPPTALLLLVVACAPLHDKRPAALEIPNDQRSGWLMNRAQMHQAGWELPQALDALRRALHDSPREGYTHQLIAATLAHGYGLGEETVAVYRYLASVDLSSDSGLEWFLLSADSSPVDALVFGAFASLEAHRQDRFSGPTAPWFVDVMEPLAEIAASDAFDEHLRYEALIAQRNLLFSVQDRDAARAAGMAAHALRPDGLQGRITALGEAVRSEDVDAAVALCGSILETDPWAVEACSLVPEAARDRVDALLAPVREQAEDDPVIANELAKYERRSGSEDAPPFVDNRRWYRKGTFRPSAHYDLLRGVNEALSHPEVDARWEEIVALEPLVPEPLEADSGVLRYLAGRKRTAEALGKTADEMEALVALCELSEEPIWCQELAGRTDGEEALEAIRLALETLDAALDWKPVPRLAGDRSFAFWSRRQGLAVASARAREEELLSTLPEAAPYAGRLVSAWPAEEGDAAGWVALAARDDAGDGLRVHAALQAVALDPDADVSAAWPAFDRVFVMVPPEVDRGELIRAVAEVRRGQLRDVDLESPRDVHPFVGEPAPALTVTDLAGETIALEDLHGSVVLVDFWATWCAPCIKELPELEAALDRLGDAPVRLLALSVDDTVEVVAPFVEEGGYTFDFAWIGPTGTKQDWMVKGIPSLFVIGPDGTVAHHHQGYRKGVGETLEAEVRALLQP